VTCSGKTGDHECFGFVPILDARRHYEREPVRRNHGMEESNCESRCQKRYENNIIHLGGHPVYRELISRADAKGQ